VVYIEPLKHIISRPSDGDNVTHWMSKQDKKQKLKQIKTHDIYIQCATTL